MDMQTKSAAVEIKTNSTPGEFTAVISAIGNLDRQNDRAMPGSFKSAIDLDPIPPVYWSHMHHIPPMGDGIEWYEQGKEIVYKGALFVKGDDEHQYAKMCYAGMKSRDGRPPAINQFSYTYGVPEGGAERIVEDGKSIRLLHEIRPVAEVGPCFIGANPETYLIESPKSEQVGKLVVARKAEGRRTSMKQILAETLGVKDYGDIDGYEIRMLLDMLDSAVSFIQFSDEDDDTVAMQGIANTLLGMLTAEFGEVTDLMAQGDAIDAIISGDAETSVEVDVTITSASADPSEAGLDKKEEPIVVPAAEKSEAGESAGEEKAADEVVGDEPKDESVEAVSGESKEDEGDIAGKEASVSSDAALTVSDDDEIARLVYAWPSH